MVPVLRMKKNNLKYRISEFVRDETVSRELYVNALYQHYVRKAWQPIRGQKYQVKVADAELNLAETKILMNGLRYVCYSLAVMQEIHK